MSGGTSKISENDQPGLFDSESVSIRPQKSPDRAVMYCDGACSGNPGKSGIGVVIYVPDDKTREDGARYLISEYIGIATNNIAEYTAFLKGLEKLRSLGIRKIRVFMDSELLVRQMTGVYKVKNKKLISLWKKANDLLRDFERYSIQHVRRELNAEADQLAREAVKKRS